MESDKLLQKYSTQLAANPLKISLWELLLNHLTSTYATPPSKTTDPQVVALIASTYRSMLVYFPYLENYHVDHALFLYRAGDLQSARLVFKNALAANNNRSLLLWCEYLKFLTRVETNSRVVLRAFEKAEFSIGMHYFGSPFWDLYLAFLTENNYPRDIYLRLLRKIIEIPQYGFAKYHTLWLREIDEAVRDIADLKKFADFKSLNKKFNIDLQKIINTKVKDKGYLLQDLKLKLQLAFKELYQAVEYQTFELYQLFELPLTMYKKSNNQYYVPSNIPLSNKTVVTWLKYLDYTISQKNKQLTLLNFQRCLNSANIAHSSVFWLKYADWLMLDNNGSEPDYLSALDVLKQSLKFLRSPEANLPIVCKITDIYIKLNYSNQAIVDLWIMHYSSPEKHTDFEIFKNYYLYMHFIDKPLEEQVILKRLVKRREIEFLELLNEKKYMDFIIKNNIKDILKQGKFWYLYFHQVWYNPNTAFNQKIEFLHKILPVAMKCLRALNKRNKNRLARNYRVIEKWLQKYSPENLLLFKSLC